MAYTGYNDPYRGLHIGPKNSYFNYSNYNNPFYGKDSYKYEEYERYYNNFGYYPNHYFSNGNLNPEINANIVKKETKEKQENILKSKKLLLLNEI